MELLNTKKKINKTCLLYMMTWQRNYLEMHKQFIEYWKIKMFILMLKVKIIDGFIKK